MAIKRRKTEEQHVWDLVDDASDEVVGQARAVYKTETQRTWDAEATVDGVTASVQGIFSIRKAIAAINDQLADANTVAATASDDAAVEIVEGDAETA
jgi:hypothetical protein